MMNYYQPYLLPFLKKTPVRLPSEIRRTYFLSFEDALWVLLKKRNIPRGARILLPDFYCIDVVNNIKAHGYVPVFYRLDDSFRVTPKELASIIAKHNPAVTIIFHACGIARTERKTIAVLLDLFPDMLVIEDAVHRLLNPMEITLINPNHYVIDSLRKVSPLPGSFLYQHHDSPHVSADRNTHEWWYPARVHTQYMLFRIVFIAGNLLNNAALIRYAHERILSAHDTVVGDSKGGYTGIAWIPYLHRFIDFEKIRRHKEQQAVRYAKELRILFRKGSPWYPISIPDNQRKELHVFPIGIKGTVAACRTVENHLQESGIIAWFKFPDCPWSDSRRVLFLPLGYHIRAKHISYIARVMAKITDELLYREDGSGDHRRKLRMKRVGNHHIGDRVFNKFRQGF
jgi:hypothetical protein